MDPATLWRSPRLLAATLCFVLGALILATGLAPRLLPQPSPAPQGADALDGLPPLDASALPDAESDATADLVVYISGAVWYPDVYRLPAGARVADAVAAAGGLRPEAARERVNLAEPLRDAQHVHIASVSEVAAAPSAEASAAGESAGGRLDLNRASAAELEELPGIGPTLAGRIVARREEQGPFRTVEELREVTGIGEKLFAQIAPLVTVGP
ncbi:MAG: helix-hairpin-helix domain-containing protein [Oscillochloridaceae bacterium]|nr:helix-hairpin-helix domain-containing protein [Chloroflexaceae bacterium]MDW8390878.1 helix-hairpin-helix domain-containing protein [Oscillochloridaceae bacterium]